jgi:hypothetical protein
MIWGAGTGFCIASSGPLRIDVGGALRWTHPENICSLPLVPQSLLNPYAGARGTWIRGNIHGHCREFSSCASVSLRDGIRRHYEAGARFLAITDHDHVTDLSEPRRLWPDVIFLEGFEWSQSENILFIGESVPPLYGSPLHEALSAAANLLTVICHPKPSRTRDYWTVPMIAALDPAPVGMEVYNAHYSRRHRVFGDPNPLYTDIWDALLTRGSRLWGFADDDSHDPLDFGCTFTMAFVSEPSPSALLDALRAGRFYASTGIGLERVAVEEERIEVTIASSAVGRFIGPGGSVLAQSEGRRFCYSHGGESYVRFEAEGRDGRIFLQPFLAAPFGRE